MNREEILNKKIWVTPENGNPYLHYDEMLYLQKEKIKRGNRTGGEGWVVVIAACATFGIFGIVLFPIIVTALAIAIPFKISKHRRSAYKIYLEECKCSKYYYCSNSN